MPSPSDIAECTPDRRDDVHHVAAVEGFGARPDWRALRPFAAREAGCQAVANLLASSRGAQRRGTCRYMAPWVVRAAVPSWFSGQHRIRAEATRCNNLPGLA